MVKIDSTTCTPIPISSSPNKQMAAVEIEETFMPITCVEVSFKRIIEALA